MVARTNEWNWPRQKEQEGNDGLDYLELLQHGEQHLKNQQVAYHVSTSEGLRSICIKNSLDATLVRDLADFTLCLMFTVTGHVMDTYSLIQSKVVCLPV